MEEAELGGSQSGEDEEGDEEALDELDESFLHKKTISCVSFKELEDFGARYRDILGILRVTRAYEIRQRLRLLIRG